MLLNLDNWCTLPTAMGEFRMYDTGEEDFRVVTMGDINYLKNNTLLRIHSSCLASEVFHAQDCDCADQLNEAMKNIATEGSGLIVHLHQEGRGQGLSDKIRAVRLMETDSIDTAESFIRLNLEQDIRRYDPAVKLLEHLGINSVTLMSNNPRKRLFLEEHGIQVLTLNTHPNVRPENEAYLHSKNSKLGHQIPLGEQLERENEIRFYHSDQPWGEFSNFSKHSIFIRGVIWQTVEHYYQAQKFTDDLIQQAIRKSPTPIMAKKLATTHNSERRADWDSSKEDVMFEALLAKFTQHPELHEKLCNTESRRLVEVTDRDSYWGESADGVGENRLGILLMEVRSKIKID
tara:strand:+ start:2251 stop:3288 length:1038 start_codon:yes stop_codon:yes gene_type:complete